MSKRNVTSGEANFWGMARSFLHDYIPKIRGLSPKTVEAYRISMECFLAFLEEGYEISGSRVSFDCFEQQMLKKWVAWMKESRRYSPKTIGLRITSIKSFLRFCSREDVSLGHLYETIKAIGTPQIPQKPIEYLEEECLVMLLAAYDGRNQKSRRNRALLIMLYETAARVSEVANATVGDISLAKPAHITLLGKGGKTRVVPIGDKTKEHLLVYLDEFHRGALHRDCARPLFYSNHAGEPTALSVDTISRILKKAGDLARAQYPSMPKNLYCHLLRKTKAMDLYKAGVPLPLIMQLLGHESMSTTSSFYAFATLDMMREAMEAAAPMALGKADDWMSDEKMEALYCLR